jgi:hypothetical protein
LTPPQSGRVEGLELSGEKNKVQDADLTAMNSCKRKKMVLSREQRKNKAGQISTKTQLLKTQGNIADTDDETGRLESLNKEKTN